ncbi:hypothetical protein [Pseudogracilibacillus sp. SO30301A]|uniref:hypothetical protein n=1 Tax=Pseudogracilibacillus sp. SO30301A TaxID=3098291 RepID=UPI00300DF93D
MSVLDLKAKLKKIENEFEQAQRKAIEMIELRESSYEKDFVFCYFDHSLIPEHESDSNLIIGSIYVKNFSNEQKQRPLILIKVNSEDEFKFSGKYLSEKQKNIQGFQWKRINLENLDQRNHFCFIPTSKEYLSSDETVSFQNFQINFPLKSSIIVEGFVYFNESNDGVPASNSIRVGL